VRASGHWPFTGSICVWVLRFERLAMQILHWLDLWHSLRITHSWPWAKKLLLYCVDDRLMVKLLFFFIVQLSIYMDLIAFGAWHMCVQMLYEQSVAVLQPWFTRWLEENGNEKSRFLKIVLHKWYRLQVTTGSNPSPYLKSSLKVT
jgi:hypothetical protein